MSSGRGRGRGGAGRHYRGRDADDEPDESNRVALPGERGYSGQESDGRRPVKDRLGQKV